MVIKVFKPKIYLKSIYDIDLDKLIKHKIKVLILDVDNTLIKSNSKNLDTNIINFLEKLKSKNIIPILVTNNTKKRINLFANRVDIDSYWFSLKPLNITFKKIKKKYNISYEEMGLVGDQILTDIVGANLNKIVSILVDPLDKKDNIYTKVTRYIENMILKIIKVERGHYYGHM